MKTIKILIATRVVRSVFNLKHSHVLRMLMNSDCINSFHITRAAQAPSSGFAWFTAGAKWICFHWIIRTGDYSLYVLEREDWTREESHLTSLSFIFLIYENSSDTTWKDNFNNILTNSNTFWNEQPFKIKVRLNYDVERYIPLYRWKNPFLYFRCKCNFE